MSSDLAKYLLSKKFIALNDYHFCKEWGITQFNVFWDGPDYNIFIKWYPDGINSDGYWMPVPHMNATNAAAIIKAITNQDIE